MYCPNCGTFNQEWSRYCTGCGAQLQVGLSGDGKASPGLSENDREQEFANGDSVKRKDEAGIGLLQEMGRSTAYLAAVICFSVSIVISIFAAGYVSSSFAESIIDLLRMMDLDGNLQSVESMLSQYSGTMGSAGFFSALLTSIPEILTASGLWMLFLECRKNEQSIFSTSGFTIIYVVTVIKYVLLIIGAAVFVIGGFFVILGVSSAAGENSGGGTITAVLVFLLLAAAILIIPFFYYTRLLKMISTSKQMALKARRKAKMSTFVGVMTIISAVASFGGVIISAPAGKLANLLAGAASICFAIVIFTFRDRLDAAKNISRDNEHVQMKLNPEDLEFQRMQEFLKSDDYDPDQTIVEGFSDFIARKHRTITPGIDPNATIVDNNPFDYNPTNDSRNSRESFGDYYTDDSHKGLDKSTIFDYIEEKPAYSVQNPDFVQSVDDPFSDREKPILFEKAEQERLAREKAEQERLAREKAEQERLAREKAERERAEQERLAREKAERERAEQERLAREKAEQERLERERVERERFKKEQEEIRFTKETTVLNTEAIGQPHILLIRKRNNMQTEIVAQTLRMGRNVADVDYLIKDNPAVGRHHADIIFRDGTYYIIDRNSTNHVYIDGKMIPPGQEIALQDYAEIQLADEPFVFQVLR